MWKTIWKKFLLLGSLIALAVGIYLYTGEKDSALEEIVEQIIESKTGVEIDVSP